MTAIPVLTTHDLTTGYGRGTPISRGISATLYPGELACLIGPNGAGKSTLLRTLAGMQPALGGSVHLLGDDIRRLSPRDLARRLSVVLTGRASPGALTAYELVALGRHPYTDWMGRLTAADDAVIRAALESVGAAALAGRFVAELSDGERQKVMIARALAQEPRVLILDEPTAFLDLPHRVDIMRALRALARQEGRAVLLSTHDLDLALRSADRIWLMPADGSVQIGAPEDLVLSGALEAAFRRSGVTFDPATGSFAIEEGGDMVVALHGEGIAAVWTARALERMGCRVQHGGSAALEVEVAGEDGARCWRCVTPQGASTHHTIAGVIGALQAQRAAAQQAAAQPIEMPAALGAGANGDRAAVA
ncbi:MAG: ABC transporter ATP-binding protein [Anaerolineae bacterium]